MNADRFDRHGVVRHRTIRVMIEEDICHLQLYRPERNNAINGLLINECLQAVAEYAANCKILVLHGLPDVFCFGADFVEIRANVTQDAASTLQPEAMYDLWQKLACGPFVSVAAVSGKVNAGGIGFVAACDIVLASENASFGLSELLFGVFPACVLPFLARRIGLSHAHYLALTTQSVGAREAQQIGLIDRCEPALEPLLHRHLLRLRRLSKPAVARYKNYMHSLSDLVQASRPAAINANRQMFSDPANLDAITRYVDTGKFPWEV